MIDNLLNKHQKTTPGEHAHLVKLLMVKDEQFCALMSIAAQQAETEKEITELKAKVDIQVNLTLTVFLYRTSMTAEHHL